MTLNLAVFDFGISGETSWKTWYHAAEILFFIYQMCFSKMELYFKVEYKWRYYMTENISLLFIGFSPFVCWRDIHKVFSV